MEWRLSLSEIGERARLGRIRLVRAVTRIILEPGAVMELLSCSKLEMKRVILDDRRTLTD